MAKENVRVTFYKNELCGYYGSNHKLEFSGLDDTLVKLKNWSNGLSLSLTKISDPPQGSELLPCYLMNIQEKDGDWLIALWIQTPDMEGRVASISMNSVVGQPVLHENELEPLTFAGFPAYFWCCPKLGLFATIGFQGVKQGRPEMENYFSDFLSNVSSYVVVDNSDPNVERIVGYRESPAHDIANVLPMFLNSTIRNPGELELIRKNQSSIRKVVRRGRIRTDKMIDQSWFKSLVGFLGGNVPEQVQGSTKTVKVELEYQPSVEELDDMIEREVATPHTSLDDLGFVFKGENQPHWVGRSRASATFEFNLVRNQGVPSFDSVASEFERNRDALVDLVKV